MGTKDVYNHAKKGQLILKLPMTTFKIQMHKKIFFFYENVLDLTSFSQDLGLVFLVFFLDIFSVILFSNLLTAPHTRLF